MLLLTSGLSAIHRRPSAGLTRRSLCSMVQHLTSRLHVFLPWDWNRSIFRRTRLLGGVHSVNLENVFRRIHANSTNLFHGRPPLSEIYRDLILARSMPSGAVHTNRIYLIGLFERAGAVAPARYFLDGYRRSR